MEPLAVPGDSHQLVFLGGVHRSGTSLLFRLLREHPMVSGFAGTGVPEDEGQHLQTVYAPASRFGGEGRFGFAAAAHLTELPASQASDVAARLFSEWSPYWDLDRRVLIEKSPPNLIRMRYLQSLFPAARFIVITRHPLEVALAERKRVGRRPVWSLLRHWFRCHDLMAADRERVEHLVVVRYEDLVRAPREVMDEVLGFLGLSRPSGTDRSASADRDEVNPARGDAYRTAWRRMCRSPAYRPYTRLLVAQFEVAANRHGYSLREYGSGDPAGSPVA